MPTPAIEANSDPVVESYFDVMRDIMAALKKKLHFPLYFAAFVQPAIWANIHDELKNQ